jgi:ferredoxin
MSVTMRVRVDPKRCQGHTLCAMAASAVFILNEHDGHAQAADSNVPKELEDVVWAALAGCPERAVVVEDR